MLDLSLVRIDGGTQIREELNESVVSEYAESIRFSAVLPPVIVFFDGSTYWLADGFHRYHAHKSAGAIEIDADVRNGTKRDAILYSVGANAVHGLRRTNEDKRRAVQKLLDDAEWSQWADNAIAKACAVSNHMVGRMREPILDKSKIEPIRTVERAGKAYEQNTSNIGKSKPQDFAPNKSVAAPEDSDEIENLREIAVEYSKVQKENESYQKTIDSINADDPRAEIVRLNEKFDQLNGRFHGLTNEKNDAIKLVKSYGDLLGKIRKALNIESNKEILSALKAA